MLHGRKEVSFVSIIFLLFVQTHEDEALMLMVA